MKIISALYLNFLWSILTSSEEHRLDEYVDIQQNLNEHSRNDFPKYESAKVDILREDDHGDYDLADIIALSQKSIEKDIDDYTSIEKMTLVDIHNIYRSNLSKPFPKGSDVEYVEWNNTLAWAATDWLKQCQFKHGFGKSDNMTELQGQNLYKGPSMIPSRPLFLWYQEYKYFSFSNFTCKDPYPKYQCSHMTQMLWSDSSNIGCARKSHCFPKEPSHKMVSCHYLKAGNTWQAGSQIYKYGWQCTRCERSDGNLCFHHLCVDKRVCSAYHLDCECVLDCKNCAMPNPKTCSCETCKPGWDWRDCSFPCVDFFDIKRDKPGFCKWKLQSKALKKLCNVSEVSRACRKTCGYCEPPNFEKKNMCCKGKMCPPYYVLDENCTCTIDCPSNLCLYPDSTDTKRPLVLKIRPYDILDVNITLNRTIDPRRKQAKVPTASTIKSCTESINLIVFFALLLVHATMF